MTNYKYEGGPLDGKETDLEFVGGNVRIPDASYERDTPELVEHGWPKSFGYHLYRVGGEQKLLYSGVVGNPIPGATAWPKVTA